MKKLILVYFIALYTLFTFGQGIDKVYDFAVYPKSAEWKNMYSDSMKFQYMQVPDTILERMSTENLIITCINYPAFGHIMAYSNIQSGFRRLIPKFNGLQELLKRKEAGEILIEMYKELGQTKFSSMDNRIDTNYLSIRSIYFNLFLAQDEILSNINDQKRNELLEIVKGRINLNNSHLIYNDFPNCLILARILYKSNNKRFLDEIKENDNLMEFIKTGKSNDYTNIRDILIIANEL